MADLTDAQRTRLLGRVAHEQRRAADRARSLTREFDEIVASSADAVRDDEHDPEGATIAFERAQVAALIDEAEGRLAALQRAARRLEEPDAGDCDRCGAPIPYERLLARPTATRCVSCAG